MSRSCLVAKLSHFMTLTGAEKAFLGEVEGRTEVYDKRHLVIARGARMPDIYVVRSGWLVAHTSDAEGGDFVTEICPPGDVVGVSQIGCLVSKVSYTAATPVELCPLPKFEMKTIFQRFPRLAAMFFGFVALERATMIDRLRSVGRLSARDCVALFFLQMRARLRIVGAVDASDAFEVPLSQELIGNAVGLSTVSVNRAIRQLENEGHLVRDGRTFHLLRAGQLARELDFSDDDYGFDGDWLPEVEVVEAA